MKLRNSSSLRLQHLGPCESRPWILSTLEDVASPFGQRVALNCEAKGFPVPDIFWEFHSADGRRILKLPGKLTRYIKYRDKIFCEFLRSLANLNNKYTIVLEQRI